MQEIELLITATNETSLKGYDMISDPKIVGSLSLLYNSMVNMPRVPYVLDISNTSL